MIQPSEFIDIFSKLSYLFLHKLLFCRSYGCFTRGQLQSTCTVMQQAQ